MTIHSLYRPRREQNGAPRVFETSREAKTTSRPRLLLFSSFSKNDDDIPTMSSDEIRATPFSRSSISASIVRETLQILLYSSPTIACVRLFRGHVRALISNRSPTRAKSPGYPEDQHVEQVCDTYLSSRNVVLLRLSLANVCSLERPHSASDRQAFSPGKTATSNLLH